MSHTEYLPRQLDFIGLGQMKCGSTALWEYILAHPDVYSEHYKQHGVPVKESFFYTTPPKNLHTERIWNWKCCIEKAPLDKLVGEFTVHNMDHPDHLYHIKEHSPNARLIAVLRNPTDRTYSQWNWIYNQNSKWDVRIETQLRNNINGLVEKSRYAQQIKACLHFFNPEQIMFIKYEDFKNNNKDTVENVLTHIGLSLSKYNYNPIQATVKKYLEPLHEQTYHTIASHLHDEICEIEDLLGWDCSDWKVK